MGGLLFIGLALLAGYALGGGKMSELRKLANVPMPPWPEQTGNALRQNAHYFFTIPMTGKIDRKQLATALGLLGWGNLTVILQGEKPDAAPLPNPPDWANADAVRISGQWTGTGGAPLDVSSLVPLGLETTGSSGTTHLWKSVEDFVNLHTR